MIFDEGNKILENKTFSQCNTITMISKTMPKTGKKKERKVYGDCFSEFVVNFESIPYKKLGPCFTDFNERPFKEKSQDSV